MRRVSTYLLTGLAVFLLAIAVLLRFYVVPRSARDAARPVRRELRARHRHRVRSGDADRADGRRHGRAPHPARRRRRQQQGRRCLGRVSRARPTPSGKLINATTDRVAWDRKTGEAINCCNENVDGTPDQARRAELQVPLRRREEDLPVLRHDGQARLPDDLQGQRDDPGPHRLPLRAADRTCADRRARGAR